MAIIRKNRKIAVRAAIFVVALAALAAASAFPYRVAFSAEDGLASLFAHTGLLKRGTSGDMVARLQKALHACGYDVSVDGDFGPGTESTVKEFQGDSGLSGDGIAGPATIEALSRKYVRVNPPEKHTVQRGETLSGISAMYGMSVETLLKRNDIKDPDLVYAGQTLLIKGASGGGTTAPKQPDKQETPSKQPPGPAPNLAPTPPGPAPFPTPRQRICLTFDDGPDLISTRPILAILRQYGVKATFFLIGEKVLKHPELAKEIAQDGHVLGVHGFEHKVLVGLPIREVQKDLKKAQNAINEATGVAAKLYRPPQGALDQTQVLEAAKLGMRVVMWTNIGGADLGAGSAQEVTARTVLAAADGGILMLHEGLQNTVEALPSLIESLARLGYGFQNLSQ